MAPYVCLNHLQSKACENNTVIWVLCKIRLMGRLQSIENRKLEPKDKNISDAFLIKFVLSYEIIFNYTCHWRGQIINIYQYDYGRLGLLQ